MKTVTFSTSTRLLCSLTWAILALFPIHSFGQIDQTARYEVGIGRNDNNIQLIPIGDRGLLLVQELAERGKDGTFWKVTKLDTTLNEIWQRLLIVDHSLYLTMSDTLEGKAYLMYRSRIDGRSNQLLIIDENGEMGSRTFRNVLPMNINRFRVIDDGRKVLIGGSFNQRAVVVLYDLATNRPRILPGLINEPGQLMQLDLDHSGSVINVLIKSTGRTTRGVWLKTYSLEGSLYNNVRIQIPGRMSIINARAHRMKDGTYFIMGPYGSYSSNYSRGLYTVVIREEEIVQTRRINYSRLPNFFDYMKPKRQQRIQGRIARKEEKGREPRFYFRVIAQDLREHNGELVLMGESHYEKYKNTYWNRYYGPEQLGYRRMIFDGYIFTHAFLVGLNAESQVLWDRSINTGNIKKYDLDRLVHFVAEKDEGIMLYPQKDRIQYAHFNTQTQTDEMLNGAEIELKYPNDNLKSGEPSTSDITHWYGNNYLVHGKQSIKNARDRSVPLNRRVYYLNKLQYRRSPEPN